MQWMLFLLGFFKIPLIGFVRPKLLLVDDTTVKVCIRLRRKTRNHLQSMYFGALAVGADIAAGIHVFYFTEISGDKVSFAFKGMQAEFIQRAESHVIFESNEGELVKSAIKKSKEINERVNESIEVNAYNLNKQLVAKFQMIVSVKVKQ